jgi:hypothetical protein
MTPAPLSLRLALILVRAWTRVYTTGLPGDLRQRRIAEIESDLWEQTQDAIDPAVDWFAIIGRLLRGMPDDLGWRIAGLGVDLDAARWALATILAFTILTSSIWVLTITRSRPLPVPPAPPVRRVSYPSPPPPPPPPCNPPGIGRPTFVPCTPY